MLIEAEKSDGPAVAAVTASLLKPAKKKVQRKRGTDSSPEIIVLMEPQELETIEHYLSPLETGKQNCRSHAVLDDNGNARRDLRPLSEHPDVLISTPSRIIDHLRRENISLNAVHTIAIVRPASYDDSAEGDDGDGSESADSSGELESFDHDVLFIISKISRRPRICLFTENNSEINNLQDILRHPRIIRREEWNISKQQFKTLTADTLTPQTVLDAVCGSMYEHGIIICADESGKTELKNQFDQHFINFDFHIVTDREPILQTFDGPVPVIVYGIPDIDDREASSSLRSQPGQSLNPLNPGSNLLSLLGTQRASEFLFIFARSSQSRFTKLQEITVMDRTQETNQTPEEIFAGKIKLLAEQVRQDKNPEELSRIKKLMKKNVPFHLRSYLFAYLLREAVGNIEAPDAAAVGNREKKQSREPNPDETTLFISIGKKRRVYPKDLARLFKSNAGIDDSDIGSIRVLDNYSFMSISKAKAHEAINKLDGTKYRGRTITVNFAKKKQG